MANFIEKYFGRKKEADAITKEPSFEDLYNALPTEIREEFRELAKELGNEEEIRVSKVEGDYDDLSPEERRFNDLFNVAKKEYYGVGSEE